MSNESTVHAVKLHVRAEVAFFFLSFLILGLTFDWPALAFLYVEIISLWTINSEQYMIDYVFFLPQLREFSFFLFSSSTWYNVLRRMDMRTYWKHKCCRGHASCWVYSRAKSDVSPISKSSSSSRNIVRRWDLNHQARDSFFECGLFPSRASISVTVWGVIWDKIWKKGRVASA